MSHKLTVFVSYLRSILLFVMGNQVREDEERHLVIVTWCPAVALCEGSVR